MSLPISDRYESRRGCGYRKEGGLYLVADGPSRPCGKLPIPLEVCPTCHGGIKPTRSWTWINATPLLAAHRCTNVDLTIDTFWSCSGCPLATDLGRCGLLWIGEKFYPRAEDWTAEAIRQGVSRRLSHVPKDLVLGQTWVLVAHRKRIANPDGTFTPAIFHAFRPTAIEYVIGPDDTDEHLESLVKRGITLVRVHPVPDTAPELTSQPS